MTNQQERKALPPEAHYTVQQIAEYLQIDPEQARALFRDEDGVVYVNKPGKIRRTIRIPAEVFQRVYSRMRLNTGLSSH